MGVRNVAHWEIRDGLMGIHFYGRDTTKFVFDLTSNNCLATCTKSDSQKNKG
jgi:hypothetical protein